MKHPIPPEAVQGASRTRYGSPASLYGRVTIAGHTFLYHRRTDVLVRLDLYNAYVKALKETRGLGSIQ